MGESLVPWNDSQQSCIPPSLPKRYMHSYLLLHCNLLRHTTTNISIAKSSLSLQWASFNSAGTLVVHNQWMPFISFQFNTENHIWVAGRNVVEPEGGVWNMVEWKPLLNFWLLFPFFYLFFSNALKIKRITISCNATPQGRAGVHWAAFCRQPSGGGAGTGECRL